MWKLNSQCLSIHNIKISAPIGVFDFEKSEKNKFLVSVDAWGDYSLAMSSDNLKDTLDYQIIFDVSHEVLSQEGNLIEKSCKDIADKLLKIDFPIYKLRVYIQKLNPPLKSEVSDTAFELILENRDS